MQAKVIPVGKPVNDAERTVIAHLRDALPSTFTILHNFEIHRDGEHFEVDVAVLAPHAVYLVDVKGTRGEIHVWTGKWYPHGRTPFTSPLLKLRSHARALKGLITESGADRRELSGVFVDAAVVLSAPDAVLDDPDGRDSQSVTTLSKCAAFFKDESRKPQHFNNSILRHHSVILGAIQGRAKPRNESLKFGHWTVVERLGSTSFYTEYRAVHSVLGEDAGTVILRVYKADAYLPDDKRKLQVARITNAYRSLAKLPQHPRVVSERDFFSTESEDCYVLVMEDLNAHALRTHMSKKGRELPLSSKYRLAADVLDGLAHAHAHDVVHRNLHPGNIMIRTDGRAVITQFEYARAGHDRALTIAREIVDDLDKHYQAPECFNDPGAASGASDVFSLGLVLYELFAGARPFSDSTDVFDRSAVFAEKPSTYARTLPEGFDEWLQSLCAFDPSARPSAAQALERLVRLAPEARA